MSERYYQEYGPIRRRRGSGELPTEPPSPEPPQTPRPRRQAGRSRGVLLRSLLFVVAVVALALALPYAANLLASDQAIQGVLVAGRPAGGMDRATIGTTLQQRYQPFLQTPLTLSYEGRVWNPTLAQLGAVFDLERMADDAVLAGRQGGPIERASTLWALWSGGVDIGPRLQVDQRTLQAYLTLIAQELEQPPHNAALSIAEGKVIPTAGQPGRQVLVDQTASEITLALLTLEPQDVVLRTRILEPLLGDSQVAAAADQARALLDGPLVLQQGERRWVWQPDKIAEVLTVQTAGDRMTVAVDPERLTRAVEKLAQLVDSSSAEPRVAFRGGALTITQPGQLGWRLQQAEAVAAISQTLLLPSRQLDLPVEELSPQVTERTLADLGVVELVGEGRTSFAGSASYRITNIQAGAARIDGVLIPPGEEFSFNTQLGAVDESNGFVQGYAVIGNRTQLEWGGGVCQDSTTVFRAAFWAGLPITERHAHPFYISWYDAYSYPGADDGPGMDATIYTGVQDLKFLNDTGHWLLLEADVDLASQVIAVRLYGTRPNRSVSLGGPELSNVVPPPTSPVYLTDPSLPLGSVRQTDTARRGMDIAVYRIITEDGVQRPPELFFTRFKAWPDVFVQGTGG